MKIDTYKCIRTNKTIKKHVYEKFNYNYKIANTTYCDYCFNRHCHDTSFHTSKSLKKQKSHKQENIKQMRLQMNEY